MNNPPSSHKPIGWWEKFFTSPDCLPLSFFPDERETAAEVVGLERLLDLRPGRRVADICCGAGRHLLPLVRRGHAVTGLDISPWLLARARRGASKLGLTARLVLGDARCLPFPAGAFEVAMNLFNSFGYCETDEENEQIISENGALPGPRAASSSWTPATRSTRFFSRRCARS